MTIPFTRCDRPDRIASAVAFSVVVLLTSAGLSEDGPRPNSKERSVKILIVVDSEGPSGVDEYWARNRKPGDPKRRYFRELMTADVNAAVRGCLAGGATEVFVKDDGFRDENLVREQLDPRVKMVEGVGSRLLAGLDQSFAGVMLIGLHAMEGAKDGVLAHTWSSARRRRYCFNGKEGGEVAAYAIVAGNDHSVPIILATGCEGLCREVKQLLGDGPITVPVKRLRKDGSVELFPVNEAQQAIEASAQRSIRRIEICKPYRTKFPLHIRLQLKDAATTGGYIKWRRDNKPDWPGRRAGERTLEATLKTTKHIIL